MVLINAQAYKLIPGLQVTPDGKGPLEMPGRRSEDIKLDLKERILRM